MIEILSTRQLAQARETGALVGDILHALKRRSTVGTDLLDIDRWARAMIEEAGAESCYVDYAPSFGRGPFGHYICTSVNDAVLHGRPHRYRLRNGDLLTLDIAVSTGGVAADAAISFLVGDARPLESVALIEATERALAAGIAAARPGARIGDVSHAIGTALGAAGYRVNTQFGGHGIGSTMHQDPHVPNTGSQARATSSARACSSRSSRGSWRTPTSWSSMPMAGPSGAPRAAALPTPSTPSPSPKTAPRS